MKAKSKKAKGTKLEQWVAKQLELIKWRGRRQPGSGVYRDFPHDVYAEDPYGRKFIVECKSWKNGWRTGDKAMGAADMLVIKRDYGEPCVYMSWETFAQIASVPDEGMLERAREAGL